jgi:hypothetical protein
VFVQWTDNAGHFFTNNYASVPIGNKPDFQTIYDTFNTDWIFEQDGAVLFTTNALFQPVTAAIEGETHTRSSQMPGADLNKVDFQVAQLLRNNAAAWEDFATLPGVTDATIHTAFKLSNQFYQIQDKACHGT